MPLAYNLTRREVHYRHEAFSKGLAAAGYDVVTAMPGPIRGEDVLLIWNRYGEFHELATRFEKFGGTVVVAENGYLGKDEHGQQRYALARHAHNGRGQWEVGGPERFAALNVELKDFRLYSSGHILVCPNRSFGMPGMIMPCDWANDVARRLKKLTSREIRVRPHPGNVPPKRPLADDLQGASAVVIWGSSAGVHALVDGIPVFCESPYWICHEAAHHTFDRINDPVPMVSTRLDAMRRLAWAQWTLAEIQSGEAFDHLLRPTRQAQVAASA